jgi:hypothetical protein
MYKKSVSLHTKVHNENNTISLLIQVLFDDVWII